MSARTRRASALPSISARSSRRRSAGPASGWERPGSRIGARCPRPPSRCASPRCSRPCRFRTLATPRRCCRRRLQDSASRWTPCRSGTGSSLPPALRTAQLDRLLSREDTRDLAARRLIRESRPVESLGGWARVHALERGAQDACAGTLAPAPARTRTHLGRKLTAVGRARGEGSDRLGGARERLGPARAGSRSRSRCRAHGGGPRLRISSTSVLLRPSMKHAGPNRRASRRVRSALASGSTHSSCHSILSRTRSGRVRR